MTRAPESGTIGYAALWVPDVDRGASFFTTVLGWSYPEQLPHHRRIAHATPPHGMADYAAIPPGVWDEWPRHNTLFLSHGVPDVSTAVQRIRSNGGQADDPAETAHGNAANCVDHHGLPFAVHDLANNPPDLAEPCGHGQLAELTVEVPDSAQTRQFWFDAFGRSSLPEASTDTWQIEGIVPRIIVRGGHTQPTIVPTYAVRDLDVTLDRVRAAGGHANTTGAALSAGRIACVDDQGTRFDVGELVS